jgi:tetratricopeptide (TPR) repeat protein
LSGLVTQTDTLQERSLKFSPFSRHLLQYVGLIVASGKLLISIAWNINFLKADVHYQRGLWFKQAGRDQLALTSFDKGLAFEPFTERIHYDRAFVLLNLGRLREAVDSLALCLEQTPFFEGGRREYARLLENLRQIDETSEFLPE